jgi:hypothetical protein
LHRIIYDYLLPFLLLFLFTVAYPILLAVFADLPRFRSDAATCLACLSSFSVKRLDLPLGMTILRKTHLIINEFRISYTF